MGYSSKVNSFRVIFRTLRQKHGFLQTAAETYQAAAVEELDNKYDGSTRTDIEL